MKFDPSSFSDSCSSARAASLSDVMTLLLDMLAQDNPLSPSDIQRMETTVQSNLPTPVLALAAHTYLAHNRPYLALSLEERLSTVSTGSVVTSLVRMQLAAWVGNRDRSQEHYAESRALCPTENMSNYIGAAYEQAMDRPRRAAEYDDALTKKSSKGTRQRHLLRAARRWLECGEHDTARSRALQFLAEGAGSTSTHHQAIRVLWECGEFRATHEALHSSPNKAKSLASLGRLALWRGAYDEAAHFGQTVCQLDQQMMEGWRLQGAAAVCKGQYRDAIPLLDAGITLVQADAESHAWRAQALTQLERWNEAKSDVETNLAVDGNAAIATIRVWHQLKALERRASVFERLLRRHSLDSKSGVYARLQPLAPPEEWAKACQSRQATIKLLEGILRKFRGNRSAQPTIQAPGLPTRREEGCAVELDELEYLHLSKNPREQATATLRTLAERGPQAVRDDLFALAERYPRSAHPWCYLGELELWMGNLDAAVMAFNTANRIAPARWAYIGKAAIHFLRGQLWRAHWTILRLRRHYRPLAASTLSVYRGEGLRRAGHPRRAIPYLRQAIHRKPSRLGARINLVLSLEALGRTKEATTELTEVLRRGPGLIWPALMAEGSTTTDRGCPSSMRPVLLRSLEMMRGNRSSTQLTYFSPAGELRMPAIPKQCSELAKELTPLLAQLAVKEANTVEPGRSQG